MADAPHRASDGHDRDDEAAGGRPFGAGVTAYGHAGPKLVDDGYEPLPIKPAGKAPAPTRWSGLTIDAAQVDAWAERFPRHGVGLRTGLLVGVDIDILEPDAAHEAERLARARLGPTPLVRVGRWPKRLLVYRTRQPFAKIKAAGIEILGHGQQFVAFGIHPDTRRPYHWPHGETPRDVPFEALPVVDRDACAALVAEIASLAPEPGPRRGGGGPGHAGERTRDGRGRVTDGRDGWLSAIAFHVVHDAIDAGVPLREAELTARAWDRFRETADTCRPRKNGRTPWSPADAAGKVADKLRLHRAGRLPDRCDRDVEIDVALPTLDADRARQELDRVLATACSRIEAWIRAPSGGTPRIALRATVGLGKSARARTQVMGLADRLRADGLPHKIVVLTPSHALADETAAKWAGDGADVAVLRGYAAKDRSTGEPMCLDLEAVRAAVLAGEGVHETACASKAGRCTHFDACAKQRNRARVMQADVVVAPCDALFTGFAMEVSDLALILIDEAVWPRACDETRGLALETMIEGELHGGSGRGARAKERRAAELAELIDLRRLAWRALSACAPGPATRSALREAQLTADDCRAAARLEAKGLKETGLRPGMPAALRGSAIETAKRNARIRRRISLWVALAALAEGRADADGRVRVDLPDVETGLHEVRIFGLKDMHVKFSGLPILHLDATLRPPLAEAVLGSLDVETIEAASPHMRLRLVAGRFGKGALCDAPRLPGEERRRRANRLSECVDYVRWQARLAAPGLVLVITHLAVERAFAGIPGVETAHFNAIAGLDVWRGVRTLIVVGRPLPPSDAVRDLAAAVYGVWTSGRYVRTRKGVRMRDGTVRGISVAACADEAAETMRAAVCDDELIQAIGRGRGVNRGPGDPLDVHVLADVALPLAHDELCAWETVRPDAVQRMLLGGVAVDGSADAAALHPALFGSANGAKLAFGRCGFKGQNPLGVFHREMTLKSARYRLPGPGRGWRRAWWIADEDADAVRDRLEETLGGLAAWRPDW